MVSNDGEVLQSDLSRIVSPIAESYEKQKRFISDAGHEIKTPLTIINANVDLLESDGEKEELTDIRFQTKRLTELTNDLILLSKADVRRRAAKAISPAECRFLPDSVPDRYFPAGGTFFSVLYAEKRIWRRFLRFFEKPR